MRRQSCCRRVVTFSDGRLGAGWNHARKPRTEAGTAGSPLGYIWQRPIGVSVTICHLVHPQRWSTSVGRPNDSRADTAGTRDLTSSRLTSGVLPECQEPWRVARILRLVPHPHRRTAFLPQAASQRLLQTRPQPRRPRNTNAFDASGSSPDQSTYIVMRGPILRRSPSVVRYVAPASREGQEQHPFESAQILLLTLSKRPSHASSKVSS